MLLRTVLPVGLMGLMMSAYFSAILSTADSCLMACSGNLVSDIVGRIRKIEAGGKRFLRMSQAATLALGIFALLLAASMTNVLDLMLYSYAFMVSGLLVPIIGALFWKRSSPAGAMAAMILGGATTVTLELLGNGLPLGLDGNVFGIAVSAAVFVLISLVVPGRRHAGEPSRSELG
jgi:SSS family solute:Na+ symporter